MYGGPFLWQVMLAPLGLVQGEKQTQAPKCVMLQSKDTVGFLCVLATQATDFSTESKTKGWKKKLRREVKKRRV